MRDIMDMVETELIFFMCLSFNIASPMDTLPDGCSGRNLLVGENILQKRIFMQDLFNLSHKEIIVWRSNVKKSYCRSPE